MKKRHAFLILLLILTAIAIGIYEIKIHSSTGIKEPADIKLIDVQPPEEKQTTEAPEKKLSEDNPDSSKDFFKRANQKDGYRDYIGAIKDYDQAIKLNPKFANAYLNRGYVKYKIKDYNGAIDDYNHAISLKPKNEKAYYARANAKYAQKMQNTHKNIILKLLKTIQ